MFPIYIVTPDSPQALCIRRYEKGIRPLNLCDHRVFVIHHHKLCILFDFCTSIQGVFIVREPVEKKNPDRREESNPIFRLAKVRFKIRKALELCKCPQYCVPLVKSLACTQMACECEHKLCYICRASLGIDAEIHNVIKHRL